jgi:hypothetical protein
LLVSKTLPLVLPHTRGALSDSFVFKHPLTLECLRESAHAVFAFPVKKRFVAALLALAIRPLIRALHLDGGAPLGGADGSKEASVAEVMPQISGKYPHVIITSQ